MHPTIAVNGGFALLGKSSLWLQFVRPKHFHENFIVTMRTLK